MQPLWDLRKNYLGVFYSMWKMKYHDIYRKTKTKDSLWQQKTDLNNLFLLLDLLQILFACVKGPSKTEPKEMDFDSLKPFLAV